MQSTNTGCILVPLEGLPGSSTPDIDTQSSARILLPSENVKGTQCCLHNSKQEQSPETGISFPFSEASPRLDPNLSTHNDVQTSHISPTKQAFDVRSFNFLGLWAMVIHLFLTLAIAIFVTFFVYRKAFETSSSRTTMIREADGSSTRRGYRLRQTDVVTILSASQTVLRFFGGLWTSAAVWHCVVTLMREDGAMLTDIQSTLSLHFPGWFLPTCDFRWFSTQLRWPLIERYKNKNLLTRVLLPITLIILLVLPAPLSSPILTGAIAWIPSNFTVPGHTPVRGISVASPTYKWDEDHLYVEPLGQVIIQAAAAIAVDTWGRTLPQSNASRSMRRLLLPTSNLTIGSVLANVTVPYFSVESITWSTGNMSLRFPSVTFSPFRNADAPYVALIPDDEVWGPKKASPFPISDSIRESRLLATLVHRAFEISDCMMHGDSTSYYGRIQEDIVLHAQHSNSGKTNVTNCYAYANVTYSAGAIKAADCTIVSPSLVQCDTPAFYPDHSGIKDSMTKEALVYMPSVAANMIVGNSSVPLPLNNIGQFVSEVLIRSYQASWSTLNERYRDDYTTESTNVQIAIRTSIQAEVAMWRVWIWLLMNVMMSLSAPLLWLVSSRPIVKDPEAAFLMVDPTQIQHYPMDGSYELLEVNKDISQEVGFILLREKGTLTAEKVE